MSKFSLPTWGLDSNTYTAWQKCKGFLWLLLFFILAIVAINGRDILRLQSVAAHPTDTLALVTPNHIAITLILYCLCIVLAYWFIYRWRKKKDQGNLYPVNVTIGIYIGVVVAVAMQIILQLVIAFMVAKRLKVNAGQYLVDYWQGHWFLVVFLLLVFVASLIIRRRAKRYRTDVKRKTSDTSGNLGAAEFANEKDFARYGLRSKKGVLLGQANREPLRFKKLTNCLLLAYQGKGKTATHIIPLILDFPQVNKFILDTKGELVCTTARACIEAGQRVQVLDPFSVLKSLAVTLPKIEMVGLNPLAAINYHDPVARDRLVASIAAALCNSEHNTISEAAAHFKENAQIIMEGILDYYVDEFRAQPDELNLVAMHDWWISLDNEALKVVLQKMQHASVKAKAAAAQLGSAGKDESGSMKTTVYRHLKWLRSEGIRQVFSSNGFNPTAFAQEKVDLVLVFPEDMIALYGQVMRVILGLLKVEIIQTPVKALKDDYLFILDELGQFGYSSDIEQGINGMRSRNVKFVAVFQTYGQVDAYKDKSVFKGMEVKKFLGGDDIPTMEWIVKLGDKQTVLTENTARNTTTSGKSGQKSISDSVSVSETATNLIQIRDIRELPIDEEYIFIHEMRPIKCQKVFYFSDPAYAGRFDRNPYETNS